MADKNNPTTPEETAPVARYQIVGAGVSMVGGVAAYAGETVTAAQLGDADRIQKLLAKGSIKAADRD